MKTIVVALGGNALGNSAKEQYEAAKIAAKSIANLIEAGHRIVIVHGNGPQVGIIKNAMDAGGHNMPLPEYTAMSQGYIGYHLSQTLENELNSRGINKNVATILSQVVVDKNDKAFSEPTKPIGNYYSKEEAEKLAKENGNTYAEDAGRGYRMVVASPKPIDIIEKTAIKTLLDSGFITIATGGGGMPVCVENGGLSGVSAVIDKDFTAAKLAELIEADLFVILTAVDKVKINFNKPDELDLDMLTITQAEKYINDGHFAKGSMLPKVQAAISFAKNGGKSIIGSLERAEKAINGECGTHIGG